MSAPFVQRLVESGALSGAHRLTDVSPVKLDTTALPGGSLVMLLFVDADPEPRYVMRVPRTPEHPERILTNYGSLRALSKVPSISKKVPKPVFCGSVDGLLTSIETCVPGLPLAVSLRIARDEGRREEAAALYSIAAEWLWALHAHTQADKPAPLSGGHLPSPDESIIALNDLGLVTRDQTGALRSALEIAQRAAMPQTRVHGDYNPNNILLHERERLSVIDWEFSGSGWALWDLFTLARTAWFHPAGIAQPNPTEALSVWDPRTPIGRAHDAALRRYEGRWGLQRQHTRRLFALFVAQLVMERIRDEMGWAASPPDEWRALLRASIEY